MCFGCFAFLPGPESGRYFLNTEFIDPFYQDRNHGWKKRSSSAVGDPELLAVKALEAGPRAPNHVF